MPLRKHPLGVRSVDDAVGRGATGFFADVVIYLVDGGSGDDATRVIPIQPVVGWRDGDARAEEIVATTQKREFFLEHSGDLTFERKMRRAHITGGIAVVDGDGGIDGVGVGLVAVEGVEIGEITGDEEEGVVGARVVVTGIDRHIFGAVEDGLVDFDEAKIIDVFEREGDVALPALAGLGEHTHVGVDGVVIEIATALFEGVDGVEDALDPAGDELGWHPAGPGGAGHVVGGGLGPVAHREVIVAHDEERVAEGRGGRAAHDHLVAERAVGQLPRRARGDDQIGLGGGVQHEVDRGISTHITRRVECDLDEVHALLEGFAADFELAGEAAVHERSRGGGVHGGEGGGGIEREGGRSVDVEDETGAIGEGGTEDDFRRHRRGEIHSRRRTRDKAGPRLTGRGAGSKNLHGARQGG